MATLNLESFNEILFGALKDTSPAGKIRLLHEELNMCMSVYIDLAADVMFELEEKSYDSEKFRELNRLKDEYEPMLGDLTKESAEEMLNKIMSIASEVLDELKGIGYDSEKFRQCEAVKNNSEKLFEQLNEFEAELAAQNN